MVRLTRIYPRGGDGGETSLGDGARVPKHALRVAAYGTVDEANADRNRPVVRRCGGRRDARPHPERPLRPSGPLGCAACPSDNWAIARSLRRMPFWPPSRREALLSAAAPAYRQAVDNDHQGTFTYNFVASSLLSYGPITLTQNVTFPLT
jgi:hypothetical protein